MNPIGKKAGQERTDNPTGVNTPEVLTAIGKSAMGSQHTVLCHPGRSIGTSDVQGGQRSRQHRLRRVSDRND